MDPKGFWGSNIFGHNITVVKIALFKWRKTNKKGLNEILYNIKAVANCLQMFLNFKSLKIGQKLRKNMIFSNLAKIIKFGYKSRNLRILKLKLRSSRSASNRPLRATCTKTAAHSWHADAIWKLLLFWPTVARSGRLNADLDERSFSPHFWTLCKWMNCN